MNLLLWKALLYSHLFSIYEFLWDPLTGVAFLCLYSLWIPPVLAVVAVVPVILWKTRGFYLLPLGAQLKLHVHLFCLWVGVMALLRRAPTSHVEFWSTTLLDTLTLDKHDVRGSLAGALWYYALLALYAFHALHLYWSFTYRVQMIPEIKRYQNLTIPKMKK